MTQYTVVSIKAQDIQPGMVLLFSGKEFTVKDVHVKQTLFVNIQFETGMSKTLGPNVHVSMVVDDERYCFSAYDTGIREFTKGARIVECDEDAGHDGQHFAMTRDGIYVWNDEDAVEDDFARATKSGFVTSPFGVGSEDSWE